VLLVVSRDDVEGPCSEVESTRNTALYDIVFSSRRRTWILHGGACGLWFVYGILLRSSLRWLHCALPHRTRHLYARCHASYALRNGEAATPTHRGSYSAAAPLIAEALPRTVVACCPPVWVRRDVEVQLVLAGYPPP